MANGKKHEYNHHHDHQHIHTHTHICNTHTHTHTYRNVIIRMNPNLSLRLFQLPLKRVHTTDVERITRRHVIVQGDLHTIASVHRQLLHFAIEKKACLKLFYCYIHVQISYHQASGGSDLLMKLLPTLLLMGFLLWVTRKMMSPFSSSGGGAGRNIFSIGKSKPTIINQTNKVRTKVILF